jgi:hypothetical protein
VSLEFRATHQPLSSAQPALVVIQSGTILWTDEAGDHNVAGPVMLAWDLARGLSAPTG